MDNANIMKNLVDYYTETAYTDNYIFGFVSANMVYAVSLKKADDILPYIMKLDIASRGQGYALRFKPDKAQKALLLSYGAVAICSADMFEDMVSDSKYNRGEVFEKIVTEQMFNQVWEKDNVPYTDGGDITSHGVAWQVKFEKATFTNEKTMMNMRSRG
jgi:hypothetical protein